MINVAIITGGESAEREISILSAQTILDQLDKSKYIAELVFLDKENWHVQLSNGTKALVDKSDFSYALNGLKQKFDIAFLCIHGHPAEDGVLQGYLEMIGIPYVGNDVGMSALTFDKLATKRYLSKIPGLHMAKDLLLRNPILSPAQKSQLEEFQLPLFIKPNENGSSYGVSKVLRKEDIQSAIDKAFLYDNSVLIEEFIEGKELTCGVYKKGYNVIALPITEIRSKSDFFDYEAKYKGHSDEITPAEITNELTVNCQQLVKAIFTELNGKGMSRIDFILKGGSFYLLEVNTIPGLSPNSLIPQQVRATGSNLTEFFNILLEEALNQNINLAS